MFTLICGNYSDPELADRDEDVADLHSWRPKLLPPHNEHLPPTFCHCGGRGWYLSEIPIQIHLPL